MSRARRLETALEEAIADHDLVVCSVLSGNRNFEGRVSQDVRANYLASPPLVVAYAIAGTVDINLDTDVGGLLLGELRVNDFHALVPAPAGALGVWVGLEDRERLLRNNAWTYASEPAAHYRQRMHSGKPPPSSLPLRRIGPDRRPAIAAGGR